MNANAPRVQSSILAAPSCKGEGPSRIRGEAQATRDFVTQSYTPCAAFNSQ